MTYSTKHPATAHKSSAHAKEKPPTQALAGFTKLYELNMETSKSIFEEFTHYAQAAMGAKDPQEWWTTQTGLFQALTEKFSTYLQDTRHLAESAETGFPNALGGDLTDVKKMLSDVFENAFRYTPAGAGYSPAGSKDADDATRNLIE
ncbi:MAG: phasin family protein [Rhodoferax sp.]|nr:phasin family protein [Rhodoferax sp.]MDP3651199.1 phasin family protein [Rhodoferax sp.]